MGKAPTDRELEPYLALAEELDIPVAIHTGLGGPGVTYTCCPDFRIHLGDPIGMEEVLVRHPDLRVYLMHAGWPNLESTKAVLYTYPQVYVDLGYYSWNLPRVEFHAYLKALVDAGFEDRIMFGSDQMRWPETIGTAIERIKALDYLTDREKAGILYDNAARFLRLSEDQIARHHGN